MGLQEFISLIQTGATGVGAVSLLFSQIRELLKESSNLIEPVKELIDRLLRSTSCKEDKQQLEILQKEIEAFEEQRKELEELISLSEMCEMWLSKNQVSLANQAATIVVSDHALKDFDKSEISERITDYLYLIHRALHWGRPNVIDLHFQENPSISLRLPTIYYKEALKSIIDKEAPSYLSPKATEIAKAYFEYLMKQLS